MYKTGRNVKFLLKKEKNFFCLKKNITDDAATKQKVYYKTISNVENTKPEMWDQARPVEEIPGPKPIPILGNSWRFLPLVGNYYEVPLKDIHSRLHQEFGDIVLLKGLIAMEPMIFLYSPKDIEVLLRNEGAWPIREGLNSFKYYRTKVRKDIFHEMSGLTALNGENWYKLRSAVNPILMQPRTVHLYIDKIDNIAQDFIERIKYLSEQNSENRLPETFMNELNKWSLESVAYIAFEKRLGCLENSLRSDSETQKIINSVTDMFDAMYYLETMPAFWKYVKTPKLKQLINALDDLTFMLQRYINEAMDRIDKSDKDRLQHEKSALEKFLEKDEKIAVAMGTDMIIAGIDTTSKTLGACLYYLSKYPEVQKKLRDEVLKFLPEKDSAITKECLLEMPYLKAIIKETTRLAPIAVGNLRTTPKDLVLCGYQIPKGTQVLTSNMVLSQLEKHFPRPKEYLPERWLKNTNSDLDYKNTNPFVFLPFGFGPRSCVGKRLANMEMEVALAKIIRNFELSWPYPDAEFESKILYGLKTPLTIHVKELKQ